MRSDNSLMVIALHTPIKPRKEYVEFTGSVASRLKKRQYIAETKESNTQPKERNQSNL